METKKLRDMNLGAVADELEQLRAYIAEMESQEPAIRVSGGRVVDFNPDYGGSVSDGDFYAKPVPAYKPAGRITEQDAREIAESCLAYWLYKHPMEFHVGDWLVTKGRTLLNNLNVGCENPRECNDQGCPAHYADREQEPAASVPDGWKLVPIEPTADMVIAGEDAWDAQLDKRLSAKENKEAFATYPSEETHELCSRIAYRAMLSASPAPSHSQQRAEVVPLESIQALRKYMDDWGDDADMQVIKSELGEMVLRAKGMYGCQSHNQQSDGHDWDAQDKCKKCGDRDWYAGPVCNGKSSQSANCCPSHDGEQGGNND